MTQQLLAEAPKIQHLLELFVDDCRDRQLTDETIRRYRSSIKQYLTFLKQRGITLFQVDRVE